MSITLHHRKPFAAGLLSLAAGVTLLNPAFLFAQQDLRPFAGDHEVHIMPTPKRAAANSVIADVSSMPLTYHGGPVMTSAKTYAIFWLPAHLQNGGVTSLPASYQNIQASLLSLYPGHSLGNNNTQYYQTTHNGIFSFTSYVQNTGSFGGSYVDTDPYPASGCYDSVTGYNCITDAQVQAEIQHVITLNGWTPNINTMFFLYTSSGEGSCAGSECAYTAYCAYHGYFLSGSAPVIYGNMPYADTNYCQVSGTPSPNGDPAGDAAATVTSHELTEAITDPELNAWYGQNLGDEIGDKCAWQYGANTWASGKANESWPVSYSNIFLIGHPPVYNFELQEEWDQHAKACVQVGP
jgi:hypothetical protein